MINKHYLEKMKRSRSKDTMPIFPKNGEKKSEVGACEFICYNCGNSGHELKDCHKFDRQTKKITEFDSFLANDEFARATSRSAHSIVNRPNQRSDLITNIGGSKNFPVVKLTLCHPNKEVVQVGDVMIDTGANIACIDNYLAIRLKAYMLISNTAIQGILGSPQPVLGAAYALLKHATIKKPKLLKFQVLRDFEPQMLLGNSFTEIFFAGMINHGGTYEVKLRDKSDGEWLTPELLLRFCTAEESIKLLPIHEVPTDEEIAAKQAFFDALQLHYSCFEEEPYGLETDSDFEGAEFQKPYKSYRSLK